MYAREDKMDITSALIFAILTGCIGFILGSVKFFREEKQRAYRELLPPILKFAFHRETSQDEKEFNEALSKLWLYGNNEVAKKMDRAISIMHNHSRGDMMMAFQEAVVAMRKDIQILPWQRLKPEEVNHLYSTMVK